MPSPSSARAIPVAVRRTTRPKFETGRFRATHGSEFTQEEIDFMLAMDQYKRQRRCPHPTWSQVLEVIHAQGYRRVAPAVAV